MIFGMITFITEQKRAQTLWRGNVTSLHQWHHFIVAMRGGLFAARRHICHLRVSVCRPGLWQRMWVIYASFHKALPKSNSWTRHFFPLFPVAEVTQLTHPSVWNVVLEPVTSDVCWIFSCSSRPFQESGIAMKSVKVWLPGESVWFLWFWILTAHA